MISHMYDICVSVCVDTHLYPYFIYVLFFHFFFFFGIIEDIGRDAIIALILKTIIAL